MARFAAQGISVLRVCIDMMSYLHPISRMLHQIGQEEVMALKPLQVVSVDRSKGDIFVLSFSDETTAVLTAEELAKYFADRRIAVRGFEYMLSA